MFSLFFTFTAAVRIKGQRAFAGLNGTAVIYICCCLLLDQDSCTEVFICSAARVLCFIFQTQTKQGADFPCPDWLGRLAPL